MSFLGKSFMRVSRGNLVRAVALLMAFGFIVSSALADASQKPKRRLPSGGQSLQIDSIQRWAHHFCDSVIAEIGGSDGLANGLDYLKSEIERQKHLRMDAQADSLFDELRGQLAIPPGHLHLIPMQPQPRAGGLIFGDSAHHYFLKVVPGMRGSNPMSQRVGKNLWLIEEEISPPTE